MSPSPNPNQLPQSANNSEPAPATEQLVVRRPNPPKSVPPAKSESIVTGESKTTREPIPPKSPATPKSEAKATGEPKTANEPIAPKSPATPKSETTLKIVALSKSEPKKGEPTSTGEPAAAPTLTNNSDTNSAEVTTPAEDENQNLYLSRLQPIPPPSEPLQYRAIGLVRGKYVPSEEQFTRGNVLAADGKQIDAVLLGRVMSLVKNHLDLESEHLWVVYPRTRQEQGDLHVQIVGVWEPEKLDKERQATESEAPEAEAKEEVAPEPTQPAEDGYFSIRGEVVFQSQDQQKIIVKIKQAPKKESDKPKFFKLTLNGLLEKKAVGYFWDFQVARDAHCLVIQQAQDIASLRQRKPGKPRLGGKRGGGGPGGKKPWKKDRPQRPTGVPEGTSAPVGGTPKPIPKPVPRPKRQPSSEVSS
ncbi:hypothetical protein [Floridanema evergladense]|uniref:Uncharacterized protein n=1 Tax=Floridaenema evergladense BLCC-F167 TaxID=3153639 RepID=A0ABV4WXK3_9CYAN